MAAPPSHSIRRDALDTWGALAVFGLAALLLFPVAHWLVRETHQRDQLLMPLVIVLLAILLPWIADRDHPQWTFRLDRLALGLLTGGFLAAAVTLFTGIGLFSLLAFALSIAALHRYLVGATPRRNSLIVAAVVFGFSAIAWIAPALDWPLRRVSGAYAIRLLQFLGQDAELGLLGSWSNPHLILRVDGFPFVVASECNGFGLLSSGLLLAVLLILQWRIRSIDALLGLAATTFLAVAGNLARILTIVFLAPHVGQHYYAMHEAAGLFWLAAGLGAITWLLRGFRRPPATSRCSIPEDSGSPA